MILRKVDNTRKENVDNFIASLSETEYKYIMGIPDLMRAISHNNMRKKILLSYFDNKDDKAEFSEKCDDFNIVVADMCNQEKIKSTSDFLKSRQTAIIIEEEIETQISVELLGDKKIRKRLKEDSRYKKYYYDWMQIIKLLGEQNAIEIFGENHRTSLTILLILILSLTSYMLPPIIHDPLCSIMMGMGIFALLILLLVEMKRLERLSERDKSVRIRNKYLYRTQRQTRKSRKAIRHTFSNLANLAKFIKTLK
jgi:hypothetical protein